MMSEKKETPRDLFRHGDKVHHDGREWVVIEDRGKNITISIGERFKTVIPSAIEPIQIIQ